MGKCCSLFYNEHHIIKVNNCLFILLESINNDLNLFSNQIKFQNEPINIFPINFTSLNLKLLTTEIILKNNTVYIII